MTDNTLLLRAKEIIDRADGAISAQQAIKQALLDRYSTKEELAAAAATFANSLQNQLRKSTLDIPEQDQGTLFDIPGTISNNSPQGVLFIPHDEANLGHVRQWTRESYQYHSTQQLRFKRAKKDLELIAGEPDKTAWTKARRQLGDAIKKAEIEAETGETEDDE